MGVKRLGRRHRCGAAARGGAGKVEGKSAGQSKKERDRVKKGAKAVGSGKQVQNSDKEI